MKKLIVSFLTGLICFNSIAQSPRLLVPFRAGNKWGYSDTLGKIKIQPTYDSVSLFDYSSRSGNHVITPVKLKGKPMMINEMGTVIVPPNYDRIDPAAGVADAFYVSKNGKFGVFKKGKELFPPVYDYMDLTSAGHYKVHRKDKWGLINSEGKLVIPVIYDELNEMQGNQAGFARWEGSNFGKNKSSIYNIKVGGTYKYKSSQGGAPELEAVKIDEPTEEGRQLFLETLKKRYGLDSLKYRENNTGIVYKDGKQGIYLPEGMKNVYFFSKPYAIHSIKYFEAYRRSNWKTDPLANIIVDIDGKYGIITESEKQILPFEYDNIEEKDEFFVLTRNGKVGFFILNTSYPVIQPAYDGYISREYIPVNAQWIFALFKVEKNGKHGFVGENGIAFFRD